jgi:hypothetical protein
MCPRATAGLASIPTALQRAEAACTYTSGPKRAHLYSFRALDVRERHLANLF